jgi:hypothetical protein
MSQDDPTLSPLPAPTTRRRKALPGWVVLLAFVVLAAAAVAFWFYANRPVGGIRVDDVRANLESQLPPGSTSAQIEAWNRDNGITDFGETFDHDREKSGYRAVIRNDTLFEKAEIVILFRTDKAGRLVETIVERVPR